MSKLILFPSIGRIERLEALINMKMVVKVKHHYDLILPQTDGDFFHLRDNMMVTAEIVARIQDGKEVIETAVRRFPLDVPFTQVNFFDSAMYHGLSQKMKKKIAARAHKIKNVLDKQARQALHQEEMEAPPVHQSYGGPSTLSLPTAPGASSAFAPQYRRVEITQNELAAFDTASRRFKSFINSQNAEQKDGAEVTLRKFVTSLRDTHSDTNLDEIVQNIEDRVRKESKAAIELIG